MLLTDMIEKKHYLLRTIRKRQLEFLGHVMRKEELENLSVTGKINGKRSRGRQRLTYIARISRWMKITEVDIKDHKRQEELEVHDRRRPYRTGHLDDDDDRENH